MKVRLFKLKPKLFKISVPIKTKKAKARSISFEKWFEIERYDKS